MQVMVLLKISKLAKHHMHVIIHICMLHKMHTYIMWGGEEAASSLPLVRGTKL